MIKILFVCHGNICRSPMAEAVFKNLVRERGVEDWFLVDSAAVSAEELAIPSIRRRRRSSDDADSARAATGPGSFPGQTITAMTS